MKLKAKSTLARDKRTKRNQKYILKYLSIRECVDCGEKDPVVLEFDHIKKKEYGLSTLITKGYALEVLKEELTKCVVRCSNCHKRKTAKQQGWYKK